MPNLYFISGLGADSRAFSLINSFNGYQNIFLEWIPQKDEDIKSYANRLIKNISFSDKDVIIGLSFGGLIAQEIAKQTPVKHIILLSSFRDIKDLKWFNQVLLNIRAYKLIPNKKIKFLDKFALKFFSIKSNEGKEGLLDMMNKTDPKFTKWALNEIQKSEFNKTDKPNLYNVIGTKDKLVKTWRQNKNNFFVQDGGHLMVYENAEEINYHLESILKLINGRS